MYVIHICRPENANHHNRITVCAVASGYPVHCRRLTRAFRSAESILTTLGYQNACTTVIDESVLGVQINRLLVAPLLSQIFSGCGLSVFHPHATINSKIE